MKKCSVCKTAKPESEFYCRAFSTRLRAECKICSNSKDKRKKK